MISENIYCDGCGRRPYHDHMRMCHPCIDALKKREEERAAEKSVKVFDPIEKKP